MISIPEKLDKEIKSFCKLNEIKDVKGFIVKCLTNGFNIEKYGLYPYFPFENKGEAQGDNKIEENSDSKPKKVRVIKLKKNGNSGKEQNQC